MIDVKWVPVCDESGQVGVASVCRNCGKVIDRYPSYDNSVIAVVCKGCGEANKVKKDEK